MQSLDVGIKFVQLIFTIAGFAGLIWTIRQRTSSDNRSEWWKRYTWSVEQTAHGNDEIQEIAWRNLEGLTQSSLLTKTEVHLVQDLAFMRFQSDNEDNEQEGTTL